MPARRRVFPSVNLIRESLRYEDGRIFWLERPIDHFKDERTWKIWNTKFAGEEAGTVNNLEYGTRAYVCINYVVVPRSFVVWVLHHGDWPRMILDHENRNTLDDRIDNLRLATTYQSNANQRSKKKEGSRNSNLKGVQKNSRNTWSAIIRLSGKRTYLGSFGSPEEAHAAYVRAAREHFGEFACEG